MCWRKAKNILMVGQNIVTISGTEQVEADGLHRELVRVKGMYICGLNSSSSSVVGEFQKILIKCIK
jgi:hypothetical protein